jgi:hypothetical protein
MIKDKPGLTRLTWNTDWAFLEKQPPAHQTKNKKSTFSDHLRAFFLTNPPP